MLFYFVIIMQVRIGRECSTPQWAGNTSHDSRDGALALPASKVIMGMNSEGYIGTYLGRYGLS